MQAGASQHTRDSASLHCASHDTHPSPPVQANREAAVDCLAECRRRLDANDLEAAKRGIGETAKADDLHGGVLHVARRGGAGTDPGL